MSDNFLQYSNKNHCSRYWIETLQSGESSAVYLKLKELKIKEKQREQGSKYISALPRTNKVFARFLHKKRYAECQLGGGGGIKKELELPRNLYGKCWKVNFNLTHSASFLGKGKEGVRRHRAVNTVQRGGEKGETGNRGIGLKENRIRDDNRNGGISEGMEKQVPKEYKSRDEREQRNRG